MSRPTFGRLITDDIFKVLPIENYDPEDEVWQFPPGTFVKCHAAVLDNKPILIASSQVEKPENLEASR